MLANYCKSKPNLPCAWLGVRDANAVVMLGDDSWWASGGRWKGPDGQWTLGVQLAWRNAQTNESKSWNLSYEAIESMLAEIEYA